jgi:uncharacterized protein (DUF1330 family)
MKKGYWVVFSRGGSDDSTFNAYAALAVPAIQSFGGRFLTMPNSRVQGREAGLALRAVVVEFDSFDIALKAHASAGYTQALQALGPAADRDFRIVEGA